MRSQEIQYLSVGTLSAWEAARALLFFLTPSNRPFAMNIYIANLNSAIGEQELTQLFATYGRVSSAQIMKDLPTGESRGFGYVEMEDEAAAQEAIAQLNETEWQTLTIFVQEARSQQQ